MENYRTQAGYVQTPEGYWVPATHAMGQSGNSLRATSAYGNADYTGRIGSTAGSSGIPLPGQGGGPSAAEDAKLEEQRRLAFGSLNQGANYFAGGLGQNVESAIGRTLSGADVPYTQAVQDRLFASQADLAAGQEAGARDMIRSQLAERGMEGSGAGLAALLGAGRERSAANTQALSQIQNTAQLENFGARERARQQGESFLSSRSAAEAPYRLKEADLRSRFEVTGQSPLGALGGMFSSRALGGQGGSPQQGLPFGPQVQYPRPAMQTVPAGGGIKSAMPGQAQQATQATQGFNAPQNSGYVRSTPQSRTIAMSQSAYNANPAAMPYAQSSPTGQIFPTGVRQPFNIGQW